MSMLAFGIYMLKIIRNLAKLLTDDEKRVWFGWTKDESKFLCKFTGLIRRNEVSVVFLFLL